MLIASHISAREDVAHGARALARAGDAVQDRRRVVGVERQQPQHLVARRRTVSGGSPEMIASSASQRQPHAGGVVRAGLQVGVEDAVEHARGVLGAGQLAADPVQLVGDPGEHRAATAAVAAAGRIQSPPSGRPGMRGGDQRREPAGRVRAPSASSSSTHVSLEPPPWRGVDDHRALAQRDAREAAGDDADVLAEDRERAQVDVARRRARRPGSRSGRSRAARAPGRSSARARA